MRANLAILGRRGSLPRGPYNCEEKRQRARGRASSVAGVTCQQLCRGFGLRQGAECLT